MWPLPVTFAVIVSAHRKRVPFVKLGIRHSGVGTQKVEDAVKRVSKARVARMDATP
jgi:hypothetical protein